MAPGISLSELTVSQVHAAYKNGDYTCHNLVQAYLDRIDAVSKKGAELNAVLAVSATALQEAEALDSHFKSSLLFIGPLHGVPVLIKDQVETMGLTTTYGSIVAKDNVPEEDATVVKKLKEAGAVVLGKTSMPDWAMSWFSTSSIAPHLTKNPYALDRDPGGSSSGAGSSIAGNLALLGLGEDTGGSIRLPASFCGLVGLRPTPGMISRKGLSPLMVPQDTPGPMTRTVRDAALMFDAMVGFDEADPYTATAVVAGPPVGGSYAANLQSESIRHARLGVMRAQHFGPDSDPDSTAVNKVIDRALDTLRKSGTEMVDIEIPDLERDLLDNQIFTCRSRNDIDTFLSTKEHLSPRDISSIRAAGLYHQEAKLVEFIAQSPPHPNEDPEYLKRLEARERFQKKIIAVFAKNNIDALVFPDCKIAAPTHEDILKPRWTMFEFPINTILASDALLPAITVPAGLTEGGVKLPVGLEMVGLPYQEQKLLQLAFGVEDLVKGRIAPDL